MQNRQNYCGFPFPCIKLICCIIFSAVAKVQILLYQDGKFRLSKSYLCQAAANPAATSKCGIKSLDLISLLCPINTDSKNNSVLSPVAPVEVPYAHQTKTLILECIPARGGKMFLSSTMSKKPLSLLSLHQKIELTERQLNCHSFLSEAINNNTIL